MPNDSVPESGNSLRESRRQWIKKTVGGCAGLAVGTLIDVPAARAATQSLQRRGTGSPAAGGLDFTPCRFGRW